MLALGSLSFAYSPARVAVEPGHVAHDGWLQRGPTPRGQKIEVQTCPGPLHLLALSARAPHARS
jgi:hypothetical protein